VSDDQVSAWLVALDHPRKAEITRLVAIIAKANPRLAQGIKWNAPSFALDGTDCITLRVGPGDILQIIFHRGAKKRDDRFAFADPTGLLDMRAEDRGLLDLKGRTVNEMAEKVAQLVRSWTP
jgi:hypothetical protein